MSAWVSPRRVPRGRTVGDRCALRAPKNDRSRKPRLGRRRARPPTRRRLIVASRSRAYSAKELGHHRSFLGSTPHSVCRIAHTAQAMAYAFLRCSLDASLCGCLPVRHRRLRASWILLLASLTRTVVATLVVAVQQEDHLAAVEMHEQAESGSCAASAARSATFPRRGPRSSRRHDGPGTRESPPPSDFNHGVRTPTPSHGPQAPGRSQRAGQRTRRP